MNEGNQEQMTLADARWVKAASARFGRPGRTDAEWVARWNENRGLWLDVLRMFAGYKHASVAELRKQRLIRIAAGHAGVDDE